MQWEMVEATVRWFKYKRWPLPLFVVVIMIVLSFIWASYDPSETVKERSIHPEQLPVAQATPTPTPVVEVVQNRPTNFKPKVHTQPKEHALPPQSEEEHHEDTHVEQGNVSHFRNSLTDSLKVEGLDPSVAEKIFQHMRAQLNNQKSGYDIEDSIRAVLPQASDEEVYRIKDLVSSTATESSHYFHSR